MRTKEQILGLLLGGALCLVACGDDGTDTEAPFNPVTLPEAAAPAPIDAGTPATTLDTGVVIQNPIVMRDASVAAPAMDSSVTIPDPPKDAGAGDATVASEAGSGEGGVMSPPGSCCPDGKCLCHGPAPTKLTSARGPYKTASYTIAGTGCVYYPTDAEAPFAAVTVSDGFLGAGGCGSFQTGQWGPLYASWGIVAMIVNTGSSDQPNARGRALLKGITAFKAENTKSGSPLNGKLSGRYGTSGFSMGGGGTSYASRDDKTLLTSVAIMPWGPVTSGITTPTLVICGSSDGTAPCSSHGNPLYRGIGGMTPKMKIQISSGHAGQPSSGGGKSGEYGLAFQKVFLEGDTRWMPFLSAMSSTIQETTIK